MKKKEKKIGLWKYIKKHFFGLCGYITIDLIAAVCTILSTLSLADAIMYVAEESKDYDKAIIYLIATIVLYLLRRVLWALSSFIYQKIVHKVMVEINYDIANQTFKLKSKTFSDNNTGTFVQRMVYEPENVIHTLGNVIDIITGLLTSFVIVIYITTLNIYIGLVVFGIIGFASIIERIRLKQLKKNKKEERKQTDKVNSISTEIVRSEKDIKSLGLEEKLSEVQKKYFADYKNAKYKQGLTNVEFNHFKQALLEISGIVLLILGVIMLQKGAILLGTFMLVYSNHNELYNLVWSLGNVLDYITNVKVSSVRIFELFNDNIFPSEKFGDIHLDNVKGKIEFKRVDYSFVEYEQADISKLSRKERKEVRKNPPPLKIKSTNKVLDKISFKIDPNTTVAFVGKSGSGKSTILNLMSKLYEADEGKILIDGININNLDKETLRKNISLVNQFPYIFDMTIKENLLLAKKDATDEEILIALNKSSLSEFIQSLPDGINTKVGESGIKLSGGQKQRLAIARAMLRDSSIIIFDESTSSLDNFAQEDIRKSIDEMKGKSTIVIVAHRLSTIRNVDKIFFLDEGKIVDVGTFEQLFENNVKFRNMFYAENL